ncbi:winged helix DNA-binding protein [Altericroceibacterium endophyticum]|uniref:Winged helix DNA-binding protein n=1 Tax=Altericroceibacterium endophyticum TaxID=1808508 RepID=A0A6I4T713_9SPHN|nr:winged helix DNA-binding protein [Altericroceibacterium endophyticum]MXO66736.1 winged helix DNA-binding protein [Altericroceibacterium endophyticum]
MEFAISLVAQAYNRWIVRCAIAAGAQLTPLEVLILHTVRHRDKPKRFMDILLILQIEDAHLANYAVGKLQKANLVHVEKAGKEKIVGISEEGIAWCDAYRDLREQLLVEIIGESSLEPEQLSDSARQLQLLASHYNQATRAVATM